MVKIVKIPESFVLNVCSRKNNHRCSRILAKEKEIQAEEYQAIRQQTDYENWRTLKKIDREQVITLDETCTQILAQAGHIGRHTFELPQLYHEELCQVIDKIENELLETTSPFFVRLSKCSTKGGHGGVGPFWNGKQIVRALVTSYRCVDVFSSGGICKLYVSPFNSQYNPDDEFRVFVYNKKVTCISQYNEKEDCGWGMLDDETLSLVCSNIIDLYHFLMSRATTLNICLPDSLTMDVLCLRTQNFATELVEFNTFGAQMSAGSCLFDWIDDYDLLHSGKFEEMRVIK